MEVSSIAASSFAGSSQLSSRMQSLDPAEQRRAVSQQFEAILIRQFLSKSLGALSGSEGGASGEIYGYMLTDTIAGKLSSGGKFGFAQMLEKQLAPRTPANASAKEVQP